MTAPPLGTCALPGCGRAVPGRHLLCPDHWGLVPRATRTQFEIASRRQGRLSGSRDAWRRSEAARRCVEAAQMRLLKRHVDRGAHNLPLEF